MVGEFPAVLPIIISDRKSRIFPANRKCTNTVCLIEVAMHSFTSSMVQQSRKNRIHGMTLRLSLMKSALRGVSLFGLLCFTRRRYSSGVRNLVAQLLKKDPSKRPSTGAVLRRPLLKDKIGRFLSEAQVHPSSSLNDYTFFFYEWSSPLFEAA